MHKNQSRCHNLPLRTWIGGVNLLGYYGTDGKKVKNNTTLQDDEEEEEEEEEYHSGHPLNKMGTSAQ